MKIVEHASGRWFDVLNSKGQVMTSREDGARTGAAVTREVLPKNVEDYLLPFCACGRRWSECDGSRKKCSSRARPAAIAKAEGRT